MKGITSRYAVYHFDPVEGWDTRPVKVFIIGVGERRDKALAKLARDYAKDKGDSYGAHWELRDFDGSLLDYEPAEGDRHE